MTDERQQLQQGVKELGYDITDSQAEALIQYLEKLEITNQSFNLTRIPRADYVTLHLLDSLTALKVIDPKPHTRILDIGTGAGFPGVPLAAMMPGAEVTLLDSTAKKVRFAAETAHACGIPNCIGIHERAEKLAQIPQHRGQYDVVISRAVAAFDSLIALMLPLVRPGGRAIALKGSSYESEIAGTESLVRRLGGGPPRVVALTLPGTDIERHLIIVDKKGQR